MTADLDALRARVGAATGPDRRLDRDLVFAFPKAYPGASEAAALDMLGEPPDFTASIDSALALVTRLLPEATELALSHNVVDDKPWWQFELGNWPGYHWSREAPTAPLAILAALLAALPASTQEMNDG